jgi:hypothetical protein
MTLAINLDLPSDLERFRLPGAVSARLQTLLDHQDSGQPLTIQEREEAEGLIDLAELLYSSRRGLRGFSRDLPRVPSGNPRLSEAVGSRQNVSIWPAKSITWLRLRAERPIP